MFLVPRSRGGRWRSRLLLSVAALASVALVAAACGGDDDDSDAAPTSTPVELGGEGNESAFMGVRVSPSIPKPEFVLTDSATGEDYDLMAETEGYLTLFYLGYTNCPSECPIHMLDIANVLDQLPEDVRDQIKVVFVTTDPDRDSEEVIRTWLDNFDPTFIGLTSDKETLEAVQRSVGLNPAAFGDEDAEGNYRVQHAAYVMAFTAEDNLSHLVYPLGVTEETWLHDLEKLVTEGYAGAES